MTDDRQHADPLALATAERVWKAAMGVVRERA
jgi:hypothetical protein